MPVRRCSKQVTGTSVAYATNTDTQVLRINDMYYACDQAVWFVSKSAKGPWVVSDSVPKAVQTIPPSSPVYNVKYVQVYQATPTVVYVGYTPGYTWAFPYYGTVVYGTGYVYPAYISPVVYYPPPVTYGVAVRYNPWTGWTVGFGYGTPFLVRRRGSRRPALLRRVVRSVWSAAISAAVLPAAVLRISRVPSAAAGLSSPAAGLPSATGQRRVPRRTPGRGTCTDSRRIARATRRRRRSA